MYLFCLIFSAFILFGGSFQNALTVNTQELSTLGPVNQSTHVTFNPPNITIKDAIITSTYWSAVPSTSNSPLSTKKTLDLLHTVIAISAIVAALVILLICLIVTICCTKKNYELNWLGIKTYHYYVTDDCDALMLPKTTKRDGEEQLADSNVTLCGTCDDAIPRLYVSSQVDEQNKVQASQEIAFWTRALIAGQEELYSESLSSSPSPPTLIQYKLANRPTLKEVFFSC